MKKKPELKIEVSTRFVDDNGKATGIESLFNMDAFDHMRVRSKLFRVIGKNLYINKDMMIVLFSLYSKSVYTDKLFDSVELVGNEDFVCKLTELAMISRHQHGGQI